MEEGQKNANKLQKKRTGSLTKKKIFNDKILKYFLEMKIDMNLWIERVHQIQGKS